MIRTLALSLTLLAVPGLVLARKIPPCPGGRYLLDAGDAGLIFGDQTPTTDAVTVGATSVTTPTCGSATAKPKGTKKGTVFHAKWKTCAGLKNVTATGTIADGCTTMTGTIKAKKVAKRTFTAHLSTGCGDGLLDKGLGEQCEADADCTAAGATCASCACSAPTMTTTTAPSASTTTTPATSTTTTTVATCQPSTTAPNTCGNCVVDPGETCDDGNTMDGDFCPHDCVIQSCTPLPASTRTFSIGFTPPAGVQLAAIQVLIDYPEGQIVIPGSGDDSQVVGSITHVPFGKISSPNDLDYALIEAVAGASAITPGRLFTITFQDCDGAAAPTAGDFTCAVVDAANTTGDVVDPATVGCNVTAP